MYNQWYKPEPGHPFRPILAFPSKKVLDIDPAWASCSANLFTGIDPPRALGSTNAMAAPAKTRDAFAPQTMSVPVSTPTLETQAQAPSAPEQDSQIVAPQKATSPPMSITNDQFFTDTSPAQPGSKPATPQISGEVPASPGNKETALQVSDGVAVPAAQTLASVGGYPIVALPLQHVSESPDRPISATASDTSDLAADKYQKDWTDNTPNQSDDLIPKVYQVGSSQITAGGPTLTISGTVVFAPTSGDCVVVGGQTFYPSHLSDSLIGSAPIPEGAQPTSIGEQHHVTFDSKNTGQAPDSLALPATNTAGNIITPLPSNAGIAVDGIALSPTDKTTGNGGQVLSNAGNGIVVVGNETAKLNFPSAGTGARGNASTTAGGYFLPFEGRASRDRGMLCWYWVWSFAAMFVGLVRR